MIVSGIRKEKPLSLEQINFEVVVQSTDIAGEDMERVLKLAEEISPVWIALKNNVQSTSGYKIIRP